MDGNVADMLMRSAHFIVERSMNLTLDRQVDGQVEVNHFLTIRPLDPMTHGMDRQFREPYRIIGHDERRGSRFIPRLPRVAGSNR
jgi:hypothetical protein